MSRNVQERPGASRSVQARQECPGLSWGVQEWLALDCPGVSERVVQQCPGAQDCPRDQYRPSWVSRSVQDCPGVSRRFLERVLRMNAGLAECPRVSRIVLECPEAFRSVLECRQSIGDGLEIKP